MRVQRIAYCLNRSGRVGGRALFFGCLSLGSLLSEIVTSIVQRLFDPISWSISSELSSRCALKLQLTWFSLVIRSGGVIPNQRFGSVNCNTPSVGHHFSFPRAIRRAVPVSTILHTNYCCSSSPYCDLWPNALARRVVERQSDHAQWRGESENVKQSCLQKKGPYVRYGQDDHVRAPQLVCGDLTGPMDGAYPL